MTTIDGHTIYITEPEIESIQNVVPISIAGTDFSHIDHLGYDGLSITLNGYESTRDAYNLTMSYLMSDDEMILVLDSGYTYKVHTVNKTYVRANESIGKYPYSVTMVTRDPYSYGVSTITRSKSITSADQEWNQDDSTNDISTAGNVDAKPDIRVTGGAAGANYDRIYSTHEEVDEDDTGTTTSPTYVLMRTTSYDGLGGQKINLTEVGQKNNATSDGKYKITYQFDSGSETTIIEEQTTGTSWKYHTTDVTGADGDGMDIRYYLRFPTAGGHPALFGSSEDFYRKKREIADSVDILNTVDEDIVCNVGNLIFEGMISRINADGSGHVDYTEDMASSTQFLDTSYDHVDGSLNYDAVNDEIDIADDGYLIYKFDVKYPVSSIPLLTATINITSGTPTIQVAKDDGTGVPDTWYDIDTAIVDNVETEYDLKSGSDVVFDGETVVFVRFDCVKTGAATLSIIDMDFDFDIITIDALIPIITTGGSANTFRCEQSATSNNTCTVALIYNDRWWA